MSRESRILTVKADEAQKAVQWRESFGWELLSIQGAQVSMSRETQNPVYPELVKFEHAFEVTKNERDSLSMPMGKPSPISGTICFFLFLLAIFPMVLYIKYKIDEKRAYESAYESVRNKYAELTNKMESICSQSRAVFFSRQSPYGEHLS